MKREIQDKQLPSLENIIRIPELLAPAGTPEKLMTAVHYGADAVYLGGEQFSLRAKAGNFSMDEIGQGVVHSHTHGVKVYATVNIFANNEDLTAFSAYLMDLEAAGVDGLIVADPGILDLASRTVPGMPIHLSTQANVTNVASAQFWARQGVTRINLARELSLQEISEIKRRVNVEVEVFVHGALCISYSGRCMLSHYLTGRDANRGNCAHPCRFSYALVEEKRPGEYFPVEEDERGTYIFNAKDLCLLEMLPQLIAAGVDAIKIEGRMKSIFYVGAAVRVYRAALDYLRYLPAEDWKTPEAIRIPQELVDEVTRTGTRGRSKNFIEKSPGADDMMYESSRLDQKYEPVAVIRSVEDGIVLVEIRNTLHSGETIEYMARGMQIQALRVVRLLNKDGLLVDTAHPGDRQNWLHLMSDPPLENAEPHGILRRKKILPKNESSR